MIAPAGAGFPNNLRILVVEDDARLRALLIEVLETHGVDVTACGCAEEAIRAAATAQFDVVLSDVMMEGMGGCGLYDWLTTRRPDLSERFVFMTAEPDPVLEFVARAGRPLLAKPFSQQRLLETCREVAAG